MGLSARRRRGLLPRSQPLPLCLLSRCQWRARCLSCWQWGVVGRGYFIRHLSDPSVLGRGTCPSECSPRPRHLAGIFEASVLGVEGRAAPVGRTLLPVNITWCVLWGMCVLFCRPGATLEMNTSLPNPVVSFCYPVFVWGERQVLGCPFLRGALMRTLEFWQPAHLSSLTPVWV